LSVERRIHSFLELAEADLDAAEVLARVGNHYAAYHVQQGIEKVLKAVLLHRRVEGGAEHRLEILSDRLPESDDWRARFAPWLRYTPYATTFRYPKPGGGIVGEPPAKAILDDVRALRGLLAIARVELGKRSG
jgi:HEPN domain-containing protein